MIRSRRRAEEKKRGEESKETKTNREEKGKQTVGTVRGDGNISRGRKKTKVVVD